MTRQHLPRWYLIRRLVLLGTIGSALSFSTQQVNGPTVQRILAKDVKPSTLQSNLVEPLLIQDALSPENCEACCELFMKAASDLTVNLQCQNYCVDDADADADGLFLETDLYPDVPLLQALGLIMTQSNSRKGLLVFGEGLLEEHSSLQTIQQHATNAREHLFQKDQEDDDDPDWFDAYFPESIQLSDAVSLAGAGAVSSLHRDPWEWTGTSLCLEGTKLWRFVPPVPTVEHVDEALQSYRLESNAWGSTSGENEENPPPPPLSAGWQTDEYSLFHTRMHDKIPTALELNFLLQSTDNTTLMKQKYQEALQGIAYGDTLHTNLPDNTPPFVTAIQQPGDLLLIPAHWWHQTYGLEPSVSIASQRCGKHDASSVFAHVCKQQIKDDVRGEEMARTILANAAKPQEAVRELLKCIDEQRK